jgi:hypothetical protein
MNATILSAVSCVAFLCVSAPQDDPRMKQAQDLLKQFGGGFLDFSEDLRKPDTAVVYGTMAKYSEVGSRERISDKDANLGEGGGLVQMSGTIFYKAEAQGDVAITRAFCGDAKGKNVTVSFTLQIARVLDGTERVQILTTPKFTFSAPQLGLWVLTKEKGKKNYRVARLEKFDLANEKSADPIGTLRKRAEDFYAINRRKADLADAVDFAEANREKQPAKAIAKLRPVVDGKIKMQLVDNESTLTAQCAALEKRAKDILSELEPKEKPASAPAGGTPPEPKPPL